MTMLHPGTVTTGGCFVMRASTICLSYFLFSKIIAESDACIALIANVSL